MNKKEDRRFETVAEAIAKSEPKHRCGHCKGDHPDDQCPNNQGGRG